jgi:hypothetical protein
MFFQAPLHGKQPAKTQRVFAEGWRSQFQHRRSSRRGRFHGALCEGSRALLWASCPAVGHLTTLGQFVTKFVTESLRLPPKIQGLYPVLGGFMQVR